MVLSARWQKEYHGRFGTNRSPAFDHTDCRFMKIHRTGSDPTAGAAPRALSSKCCAAGITGGRTAAHYAGATVCVGHPARSGPSDRLTVTTVAIRRTGETLAGTSDAVLVSRARKKGDF